MIARKQIGMQRNPVENDEDSKEQKENNNKNVIKCSSNFIIWSKGIVYVVGSWAHQAHLKSSRNKIGKTPHTSSTDFSVFAFFPSLKALIEKLHWLNTTQVYLWLVRISIFFMYTGSCFDVHCILFLKNTICCKYGKPKHLHF